MSGLTAFAPTETGISPGVTGADPALGPIADDSLGSLAAGRAADR
jgi:hypothetical protein